MPKWMQVRPSPMPFYRFGRASGSERGARGKEGCRARRGGQAAGPGRYIGAFKPPTRPGSLPRDSGQHRPPGCRGAQAGAQPAPLYWLLTHLAKVLVCMGLYWSGTSYTIDFGLQAKVWLTAIVGGAW